MTIYAVLAPPVAAGSTRPDPDGFLFIKEGFSWPAFLFAPFWLVARRMWIVLALYLAAFVAVSVVVALAPSIAAAPVMILFNLLVGLEANNLRRWTLERRGWRLAGAASGDRLAEAEFRFFATWPGFPQPMAAGTPIETPKSLAPLKVGPGDVIGLFPKPGGAP